MQAPAYDRLSCLAGQGRAVLRTQRAHLSRQVCHTCFVLPHRRNAELPLGSCKSVGKTLAILSGNRMNVPGHPVMSKARSVRSTAANFLLYCSILLWDIGLSPGARWLLQVSLHGEDKAAYVNLAHAVICTFFGLIWLLPVYLLSFALSCIW